jgi:hypothetical protein
VASVLKIAVINDNGYDHAGLAARVETVKPLGKVSVAEMEI